MKAGVDELRDVGMGRVLATLALVGLALSGAACSSSDEQDASQTAAPSQARQAEQPAAATGPSDQERAGAVRDAEQQLARLSGQVEGLVQRAEVAGVEGDAAVQQGISSAVSKVSEVQRSVATMRQAGGEAWEGARSQAEQSLTGLSRSVEQTQSQIRAMGEAKRAQHIAEIEPLLAQGLIKGLDGDHYIAYRPAVVEQVQERLADIGLYDGPIDGFLEITTQRALRQFQQQNGIWATGIPTPKTRKALMSDGGAS